MRTGKKLDIHVDLSIVSRTSLSIQTPKYPAKYSDTIALRRSGLTAKITNAVHVSSVKTPNLLDRTPFIVLGKFTILEYILKNQGDKR